MARGNTTAALGARRLFWLLAAGCALCAGPAGVGAAPPKSSAARAKAPAPVHARAGAAPAAPAAVDASAESLVTVQMDHPSQSVAEPVPLAFGQRLTVVMPAKVRLAVPGVADVLVAHVRDEVVVLSLIDSPYVQTEKPRTHLAVLAEEGLALTLPVRVAEPGERVPEMLRVVRGPGLARAVTDDMRAAAERWLRRSDAELQVPDPEGFGALEPLLATRAERGLARAVAQGGVGVVADDKARTKADFIYLTRSPVVRLGDRAAVQLVLANRSQPLFRVASVGLMSDGRPVREPALAVWGLGTEVPADGVERPLGLVFPASALEARAPQVAVCGAPAADGAPRCVSVPLD